MLFAFLRVHISNVPQLFKRRESFLILIMRVHHGVSTSLGQGGQAGSSRHKFAATSPLPNLSTQLESLKISGFIGALVFRVGAVGGRNLEKT